MLWANRLELIRFICYFVTKLQFVNLLLAQYWLSVVVQYVCHDRWPRFITHAIIMFKLKFKVVPKVYFLLRHHWLVRKSDIVWIVYESVEPKHLAILLCLFLSGLLFFYLLEVPLVHDSYWGTFDLTIILIYNKEILTRTSLIVIRDRHQLLVWEHCRPSPNSTWFLAFDYLIIRDGN